MDFYRNFNIEDLTCEVNGILYTEEWKDIFGYEGFYQISNFGRIKSLSTIFTDKNNMAKNIVGRILKSTPLIKTNHLHIKIGNPKKEFYIHRLVAKHFIKSLSDDYVINHIDFNPLNNHVNNLEWCSRSENAIHAVKHGKWVKRVNKYDLNMGLIKEYISVSQAAKDNKRTVGAITMSCQNGSITNNHYFKYNN
jgi:hypothetical protein